MRIGRPVPGLAVRPCEPLAVRMARLSVAVATGIFIAVPLTLLAAHSASATPSRPHASGSYYINSTSTSNAWNMGCANGEYATTEGYDREDILDFGGQISGGAELINGDNVTTSQIEGVVENYALGVYDCSGTGLDFIVAVGTNNSVDLVSSSGGATWANMIDSIASSTNGSEAASQVTFRGANDIEDWYSGTSATDAEDWSQGFQGATSKLYIDFGSADGCPQTSYDYNAGHGETCSAENSSFTQHAYWYLSWGNPAAIGTPEIYNSAMPKQWLQICLFGANEEAEEILFDGPVSQNDSFTLDDSWNDFWNDLNGTACAQTPSYEIEQVTE